MSKVKVNDKVWLPNEKKIGYVSKVSSTGKPLQIVTDDEIIEATSTVVVLWRSLSWLVRFVVKLFAKKSNNA